jgi:cytochrome c-type biogenesis protein CcmH
MAAPPWPIPPPERKSRFRAAAGKIKLAPMIWLAFGLLTGFAILCALWPLARPPRPRGEGEADVAFYRAQIAELDADLRRGLVDPAGAEAARTRAARRLLALDLAAQAPARATRARWAAALVALVAIPAVAFGFYARVGKPALPDQPLAARLRPDPARQTEEPAQAVARIEKHLADHPGDGGAFERLAPLYQRLRRWDDAVRAREEAMRLLGETAPRHQAIGEAMIDAREGAVTLEANEHFERALALNPRLSEARFFIGLGAAQDGDAARARAIWTELAREAPDNSRLQAEIARQLAALDALQTK